MTQRYFCFRVSGLLLALPVEMVVEILPRVLFDPLPEPAAGVIGIINYHGRPVVFLDTAALLGALYGGLRTADLLAEDEAGESYIALCDTAQGLVALHVEELEGINTLERASTSIEKILPKDFPFQPRLVQFAAYSLGRTVFGLDPARVFSAEQFKSLAAAWTPAAAGPSPQG